MSEKKILLKQFNEYLKKNKNKLTGIIQLIDKKFNKNRPKNTINKKNTIDIKKYKYLNSYLNAVFKLFEKPFLIDESSSFNNKRFFSQLGS